MTRKHFEALAHALSIAKPQAEDLDEWNTCEECHDARMEQWRADVHRIATACKESNPRFDLDRFARACGVDQETDR